VKGGAVIIDARSRLEAWTACHGIGSDAEEYRQGCGRDKRGQTVLTDGIGPFGYIPADVVCVIYLQASITPRVQQMTIKFAMLAGRKSLNTKQKFMTWTPARELRAYTTVSRSPIACRLCHAANAILSGSPFRVEYRGTDSVTECIGG
jgi:hypothetical protein